MELNVKFSIKVQNTKFIVSHATKALNEKLTECMIRNCTQKKKSIKKWSDEKRRNWKKSRQGSDTHIPRLSCEVRSPRQLHLQRNWIIFVVRETKISGDTALLLGQSKTADLYVNLSGDVCRTWSQLVSTSSNTNWSVS